MLRSSLRYPDDASNGGARRLDRCQLPVNGAATRIGGMPPLPDNPVMGRTVLIVDDHAGFRASARRLLEAEGFDVVGEAVDGKSGIETARALVPDLVLLDVQLPDMDGFAVCEELNQVDNPSSVILTSTRSGSELSSLVSESDALGFVPKSGLSGSALERFLE